MSAMDVTFQRQDLLEIADRASTFRDSMLRLRTDTNKLVVSATGREAAVDPISKVVGDTLLPAVVSTPGTGNADPAELGKQARTLTTVQARLVSLSVWPGFELSAIDPMAPEHSPNEASTPTPSARAFDASPHVASFLASGKIKIRKPWTIPLFGVLTLGIYLIVWYYRINRELRDLGAICGEPGRELNVKPGRSTLAVSLFAILLVPPFVSVHRTLRRIQRAEQITNTPEPHLSTGRAWALVILVLPFWTAYVQAHLNQIWQEQLRRAIEEPVDAPTLDTSVPDLVPSSELWPVASSEAVVPVVVEAPPPPPLLPPEPLTPAPPPPPSPPPSMPASSPPPPPPIPWPPVRPSAPPSPPAAPAPAPRAEPPRPIRPSLPPASPPTPVAQPQRPPVSPPSSPPPTPRAPAPPTPPPLPTRAPVRAPLSPPPAPAPTQTSSDPTPAPKPNIHDPAIEIIRTRYARGEITRQEYRAMLADLSEA
jgi:Domain of unknown function (DUF4234)/Short C-terminal domain